MSTLALPLVLFTVALASLYVRIVVVAPAPVRQRLVRLAIVSFSLYEPALMSMRMCALLPLAVPPVPVDPALPALPPLPPRPAAPAAPPVPAAPPRPPAPAAPVDPAL